MDPRDQRTMVMVLAACAGLVLALAFIVARWADREVEGWRAAFSASVRGNRAGVAPAYHASVADRRTAIEPPALDPAQAGAGLSGNPAQFFGPDAYPPEAIRAAAEGRTVAMLAVDANGIPIGCTVTVSSGWRSLDAATCAIALGRVRYRPARDAAGRPIASTTRLPVRWVLPRD